MIAATKQFHPPSAMMIRTTLNSVAEEAARLNSEGVIRLLGRDCQGAINCFTNALSTIVIGQNLEAADHSSSQDHEANFQNLTAATIPGLEDEAFHIHNQALCFQARACSDQCLHKPSSSTKGDFLLASATILFNLALASHQLGIQTGDIDRLEHACWLYRLCTTHIATNLKKDQIMAWATMTLLCCNNEAQIHYRLLGNTQEALQILQSMSFSEHLRPDVVGSALLSGVMLNRLIIPVAPLSCSAAA